MIKSKLMESSYLLNEIIKQAIRGDFRKKWQRLSKDQIMLIYKDLREIRKEQRGIESINKYKFDYYLEKKEVLKLIEEISEEIDKEYRLPNL
nr:MAG: hypothetical protein [Microvirus Sku114]